MMKNSCILASIILMSLLSCKTQLPGEYVLTGKDLVPEGIDYSIKKDAFYLTSVGKSKIVVVNRKSGMQRDFIKEHEFGYSPGVGLYIDDERELLHALGGYFMSEDSLTSLFTFDINTEKLIRRYSLSADHFLNDMIMDKKGNMYLTDSKDASVYVLRNGADSLELFYKSNEILFPNGIAISDDNTKLYIASSSNGVRILDLISKEILNTSDAIGISQGIDGLEFYKGHLYGIQNGVIKNSDNLRKLILNKNQDAITGANIIDSHNPELDVPLTFCIANNQAIVIGNSNLQHLDQVTFEFKDSESVQLTKLLVYPIE